MPSQSKVQLATVPESFGTFLRPLPLYSKLLSRGSSSHGCCRATEHCRQQQASRPHAPGRGRKASQEKIAKAAGLRVGTSRDKQCGKKNGVCGRRERSIPTKQKGAVRARHTGSDCGGTKHQGASHRIAPADSTSIMLNSRCWLPSLIIWARKRQASTVPSAYTSRPHTLCLNSRVTAGQFEEGGAGQDVLCACYHGKARAGIGSEATAEPLSRTRPSLGPAGNEWHAHAHAHA